MLFTGISIMLRVLITVKDELTFKRRLVTFNLIYIQGSRGLNSTVFESQHLHLLPEDLLPVCHLPKDQLRKKGINLYLKIKSINDACSP